MFSALKEKTKRWMLKWEYKFYGWNCLFVWNQQTANTVLLNCLDLGKILLPCPTYQDITSMQNNSWSENAVSWMLCLLQLVNMCAWEWALIATDLISEASESACYKWCHWMCFLFEYWIVGNFVGSKFHSVLSPADSCLIFVLSILHRKTHPS